MKFIKNCVVMGIISLILSHCSSPEKNPKYWAGKSVDLTQLTEVVNTYHMFDSTQRKVGSMIFGWKYKDDKLIARDTSQFDDGSVYETAEMVMNLENFKMESLSLDMQVGPTSLDVDLMKNKDQLSGQYVVKRDTAERITEVDSAYSHDIFREEIYMLLHAIGLKDKDTIELTPFIATSLSSAKAQIYKTGVEEINVPAGTFQCDVYWLKAVGPMPSNKIWISKRTPRRMVKFYVPGPELSIELIESQDRTF